jgi:hypothetical protein
MIPDRVVEVLEGPAYLGIGTRDETLRPTHTVGVGATVHDDRRTVTVCVPAARAERILRDLKANGRIAIGLGLANHESYQVKGTYLSSRPTDETDHARQERYRKALLESTLEAGFPENVARPFCLGFAYGSGVAITFRVDEVYLQTPGPGAGTRLA